MDESEWLAERFEEHRAHLRAVAYRMLGSLTEAEDALQDAWVRLSRSDSSEIENLGAWLTTVIARICLNMLRSRNVRREQSLDTHVPDPIVKVQGDRYPEDEAVLADSVGLALLVVLDTLSPAERLAFVLHDMFDLPFEEIAPMVGRSPTAARQLASRARRRVRGADVPPQGPDARDGDFDALFAVLDPEVVLRIDGGTSLPAASRVLRGATGVARQAESGLRSWFTRPDMEVRPALVNGAAGAIVLLDGRPTTVIGFTVTENKIAEIDSISDPERVARLATAALSGGDRRD
jgi:RNA polymerase sigma factor (sigma-70 family)